MLKPPAPTIPGMTDTLDFVKNLWGSMNIPGAGIAAPTLSPDDLDKRIADLKAVESWLNMNITMLRGTIQTMEVQRGTLAALKSMSASMADAMRQSGVSPDKMAANPFASFFGAPAQPGAGKPADKPPAPATTAAAPAAAGGGMAQPGTAAPAGSDGSAANAMPAAVAWWNLLQSQFQQAVASAMNAPAGAAAGAAAGSPTPPSAGAKAATPAPQTGAQSAEPAPAADNSSDNGSANGKARAAKSRADKTGNS